MTNDIYKLFVTFAFIASFVELYLMSQYIENQPYCYIKNFTIQENKTYYPSCPMFFWKKSYNVTTYSVKFDVCHVQKSDGILFPYVVENCNKTFVDAYGYDYSTYKWNTTSILLQYVHLYYPIGSKFHYTRCV